MMLLQTELYRMLVENMKITGNYPAGIYMVGEGEIINDKAVTTGIVVGKMKEIKVKGKKFKIIIPNNL